MKPNCYECIHRGNLPGDAHSRCNHPEIKTDAGEVLAMLARVRRVGPVADVHTAHKLGVTGSPHGICNGWFNWPWNFDPVWLLSCDGFTPKEQPNPKP